MLIKIPQTYLFIGAYNILKLHGKAKIIIQTNVKIIKNTVDSHYLILKLTERQATVLKKLLPVIFVWQMTC